MVPECWCVVSGQVEVRLKSVAPIGIEDYDFSSHFRSQGWGKKICSYWSYPYSA